MNNISPIVRILYVIVRGDSILCGKRMWCRFVPFSELTKRNSIVTYESEAKAKAALEGKCYPHFNGTEKIVPASMTMYIKGE